MRNKLCLAGVSALALLTSTPVLAQDLAPADEGEAIVVTGQRAQQERAIEIKRNAVGIMDVVAADEIGQLPDRKIGRASCRERVCQYVKITVVAVYVKKKTHRHQTK